MQRIQAPGPLFHARERRGKQGGIFCMLKFRSMYAAPGRRGGRVEAGASEDQRIFPLEDS